MPAGEAGPAGRPAGPGTGERGASPGSLTAAPAAVLGKPALFLLVVGGVLLLDLATKRWIVENFVLYQSIPVLGDYVRITYTHNPGAAFGINVGEHSRVFFLVLAVAALVVLAYLYWITPTADRLRLFAVALVTGGAVGNIVDRIRYERGVVDFLDVGIGEHRWPVFNVADIAVSTGAILLLVSFYLEERREREREAAGGG